MIKPAPLRKGDTIGIAASASPFDRTEFEKGVKTLEALGFRVKFRDDIFSTQRYLAGLDERRKTELTEHFVDPDIQAVFFARGGYGTLRILPLLNFKSIEKHPKIVMGYSDMTPLLIHLVQRCGWVSFHGPVVAKGMGDSFKDRGRQSLLRCLTDPRPLGEIQAEGICYLKKGKARGVLVGGCLSLIVATLKTPYEIDSDRKILFLEDINEKPYAIDRMLTQLRLAGKFEKVKGILLGPFQNSESSSQEIQEILAEFFSGKDIPIVFGFPSGHLEDMMTIPLGVEVELNSEKNSVNFVEGALQTQ